MKKIIFIVIAVVIGVGAWFGSYMFSKNQAANVKAETVKIGFKDIGELATQETTTKEVVSVTKDDLSVFNIPIPFTGSKQIFSYPVSIKAGFDFNQIKLEPNELTKTIKVKMPEVKILSCEVDNNGFQLWDEANSVFNPVKFDDTNEAISQMKDTAKKDAIDHGIYDKAKSNAETMLKGFIGQSFDLNEYKIEFSY